MSLPQRRLWEFYGPLVCRILGLAFDERDMSKVCQRFQIGNGQPLTASEMHGTLVQLCSSESNSVSKYVDKLLGERFELYEKMLEGLNQEDIGGKN
jgi:hypothetical protein